MYLARHIRVYGAPDSCIWRATFMYLARHIHVCTREAARLQGLQGLQGIKLARQIHVSGAPDSCICRTTFMYLARQISSARQRSVKGFYGHPPSRNTPVKIGGSKLTTEAAKLSNKKGGAKDVFVFSAYSLLQSTKMMKI